MRYFLRSQYQNSRPWVYLSQSQRRISPCTSNHGISPNDSVKTTVVDPSQF
jgi:hypothetical protein